MIELLTNTTFWAAAAVLAMVLYSQILRRGPAAVQALVRRVAGSAPAVSMLSLGALFGAGFGLYMSYEVPRDLMQDIVSAEEFMKGESMYPASMNELIRKDLEREPAAFSFGTWLPALHARERQAYELLVSQPWVQAHPPTMSLFVALLVTAFGIRGTLLAISGLSLAALLATLLLLRNGLGLRLSRMEQGALIAMALAWYPVVYTLRTGQIGLVLAGLITCAWYCVRRNSPVLAGVAVGVATCLKLYPGLLLLFFLLRSRRAFGTALVVITVLFGATVGITGPSTLLEYSNVMRSVVLDYKGYMENISLLSLLVACFGPQESAHGLATGLSSALALGICGGMAWLSLAVARPVTTDMEYAMYVAFIPVLTPICWAHYLVLLLLPVAVLARGILARSDLTWKSVGGFCVLCLALSVPEPTWYGAHSALQSAGPSVFWKITSVIVKAVPTIAVCSLGGWLALLIIRSPQEAGAMIAAGAAKAS